MEFKNRIHTIYHVQVILKISTFHANEKQQQLMYFMKHYLANKHRKHRGLGFCLLVLFAHGNSEYTERF